MHFIKCYVRIFTMKKILIYLKDYKKETILAPLFKLLEASFELIVPLVVAAMIDTGIANEDKAFIWKMGGILVALGIIGLVCSLTAQFFAAKAAVGFTAQLRNVLFERIQKFSYRQMDELGTSTLITRMTSDMNQVQTGVNMVLRLFLRSPFIVFGAMVMAFTIDVKAALIFAVAIPLLSIVVFGIMMFSIPVYRKVQANLDKLLKNTRESLTGARVIRAFRLEKEWQEDFDANNDALRQVQNFAGKVSAFMNPVTYIVINVALVILIHVGAIRVDAGIITQGAVVALVNYMSQILVELIKLANLIVTTTKAIASGNRIADVLATVPENMDDVKMGATGEASVNSNAYPVGEADTIVEFEHVHFAFHEAKEEALSDVHFSVKPGQTIGIIGGTGSGKSTIVNLLCGFYPATKGEIRVKGKKMEDYTGKELLKNISIVPQKAVLFKGTIESNLRWGNENATTEELWEALEVAQAAEFVREKSGQLQSEVAQLGKNFSGGQRQRLSIARAIIGKKDILVLDDSTSALDYATDAALRQAIKNLKHKPTVFIVSQRATSIQYADCILVLDDGEVVGMGTHDELLKNCETYQEIYHSQYQKTGGVK